MLDHDSDGCLATPDIAGTIGISERSKSLRDGLIEAIRSNLDGMLDAFDVSTGDTASPKRHV